MNYPDIATFIEVESNGYDRSFTVVERGDVSGIFIQDTSYARNGNIDVVNADAVFYPDPSDTFISGNYYRLEGMYIMISPYGQVTWYKVSKVTVNRDHLLSYSIDNIEVLLEKASAIPNVS